MSTRTTPITRLGIAGLAVAAASAAMLLSGATSTAHANPFCDAMAMDPTAVHVSGYYQGNDAIIIGGNRNDTIVGGPGNNLICGGGGDDTLKGGPGDDQLEGERGNDTLEGDLGDDILAGELGDDTMDGGLGIFDVCYFDVNDTLPPVNCP